MMVDLWVDAGTLRLMPRMLVGRDHSFYLESTQTRTNDWILINDILVFGVCIGTLICGIDLVMPDRDTWATRQGQLIMTGTVIYYIPRANHAVVGCG